MAALSSAESPPPVFNGDATEREPGRESGLEELGPGLDSSCSSGIPGGPQEEEVSAASAEGAARLSLLRTELIGWKRSGNTGWNAHRGMVWETAEGDATLIEGP